MTKLTVQQKHANYIYFVLPRNLYTYSKKTVGLLLLGKISSAICRSNV